MLRSTLRALSAAVLTVAIAACGTPTSPADVVTTDSEPFDDRPAGDAAADAPSESSSDSGLPRGIFELRGTDRTLPTTDLAPLAATVRDVDVVGLGESIHTSGGFARAKARMTRFLVAEQGFRVVSFENPWASSDTVNQYVQTCTGTPEDATRQLDPIWWDVATAETLQFLCEWNRAHPTDRVTFAGFDIRQPWVDEPALRRFFTMTAPTEATRLLDGLRTCIGVGYADVRAFFADPAIIAIYSNRARIQDAPHMACIAGTAAVSTYLTDNRAALVAASSADAVEYARLANVGIEAFENTGYQYFGRDIRMGQSARDTAMADAFFTLRRLRHPMARTVVWAHNLHITFNSDQIEQSPYRGVRNFGTRLRSVLMSRYASIGVIAWRTNIHWQMGPQTLPEPLPGAIEVDLHGLARPFLFVDTSAASTGADSFIDPTVLYGVGGTESMNPHEHYTAFFFIDDSPGYTFVGGVNPWTGM